MARAELSAPDASLTRLATPRRTRRLVRLITPATTDRERDMASLPPLRAPREPLVPVTTG
jgi:hypothetical protein